MRFVLKIIGLVVLLLVLILAAFRFAAWVRESSDVLPSEGRMIETVTGAVYVREHGDVGNPPVLLIHGSVGWSALWDETAIALADTGYRAIAFDMAPMGYSERRSGDDYARTRQAARVLALIDAMGIKPVLVAHSFGAGAGAEAVLRDQEAFAGFVIVDGAIGIGQRPKTLPLPLRSRVLREVGIAATATNPLMTRKLLSMFIHKKDRATPEYVDLIQEPFARMGTTSTMADWLPTLLSVEADAQSTDARAFATLSLPVGILWGAEDTTTPLAQGKELEALIDGSKLMVLPGVGHIPQIEDPGQFQQALIEMLGGL